MPHEANEATSDLDGDIARIEAMRAAGTVTADEAERLIAVLREIATVGEDIDSIGDVDQVGEAPAAAPPADPPPPSVPKLPPEPPTEAWQATPHASRWLTVRVLAGDVRIRGGDVEEPTLRANDGDVEMERDGAGWIVRDLRGGWFNRMHGTDVDVTVPRGTGVALDVKAGDVRISDVPAVRGKMMAGDLTIDGTAAIDVHKSAGDLDARVRLTHGRHRIRASAGDVNVTLLSGSDVAVQASVTMGDVRTGSAFKRVRSGLGGSVEGRLGTGAASLEVRLSAGDVRIRSEEPHG